MPRTLFCQVVYLLLGICIGCGDNSTVENNQPSSNELMQNERAADIQATRRAKPIRTLEQMVAPHEPTDGFGGIEPVDLNSFYQGTAKEELQRLRELKQRTEFLRDERPENDGRLLDKAVSRDIDTTFVVSQ
jgi:hypothetical protein